MSASGSTIIQSAATTEHDDSSNRLEIFLGGSCNPTTWRKKVAIPYLEMNGISYYNPQVADWTPEVVSLEHVAKKKAKVLLFVIDKQTRSTVSIVESAFMATQNRHLVLVIFPLETGDVTIFPPLDMGSSAPNLIESFNKLGARTSQLLDGQVNSSYSTKVGSTVSELSSSTTTSLTTLISKSSNGKKHLSLSSKAAQETSSLKTSLSSAKKLSVGVNEFKKTSIESIQREASRTTSKYVNTAIKISGEVVSWREFQELKQARDILQCLVTLRNIPIYSDIQQALNYVSKYLKGQETGTHSESCFDQSLSTESHILVDHSKDVFLSLDSDDFKITESILLSQLEKGGLTYKYMCVNKMMRAVLEPKPVEPSLIDPVQNTSNCSSISSSTHENSSSEDLNRISTRLALEQDLNAIKSSRVLLFVITNRCRGLSIMVLASHFMALSKNNVVLCVQDLEEPCCIGGELLTNAAIADYNRGRVYLCDYAVKAKVPIFNTIHEAVECCAKKCRLTCSNHADSECSGGVSPTE